MEPAYSFTIPSIEDDTTLDCRLYHPDDLLQTLSAHKHTPSKGAIIAHPYAPLGGCYDDPVVMSLTAHLVDLGFIVATFNFRGAGGSQGSTSWSGKGEKDDYITVAGTMLHYLRSLGRQDTGNELDVAASKASLGSTDLILAGYSYGSLILSKLPPLESIERRFETAVMGTSAAEVVLRARRLAAETTQAAHELEQRKSPRGRASSAALAQPSTPNRSRAHSLTVTVGGEETEASERRLSSRDSRRPMDLVRKSAEVPHRIKMHLRRRSSSKSDDESPKTSKTTSLHTSQTSDLKIRYLLISPLLAPLAHALVPPMHVTHIFGHHGDAKDPSTGFGALEHASLAVWGTEDGFTSSRKLRMWVEKLQAASPGMTQGVDIEGAGHFWREQGVMKQALQQVSSWVKATNT